MEYRFEDYLLSDDKLLLSIETIHELLSNSYWAQGRSIDKVRTSIEHSICYGLYHNDRQIGFTRVVTDNVSVYYICDVIIAEEYRNKGLGSFMMKNILRPPEEQNMKGLLITRNAQGFYRNFGFTNPSEPILMLKI